MCCMASAPANIPQIVVRHGAVEQHGRQVALVSPAGVMFHMSDTQACACARLRARRTNETLTVHVCTRTCVLHRRNISPPVSPAQAAAPHRPQLQPAADPEADLAVCARTCIHAVFWSQHTTCRCRPGSLRAHIYDPQAQRRTHVNLSSSIHKATHH